MTFWHLDKWVNFLEEDVKGDEFGEDVLYFIDFSSGSTAGHVLICLVSR
jgi:hypothetical protein